MAKITLLHNDYASRFIHIAGEELLQLADANDFVMECRRLAVTIVGIEFFKRIEQGITPSGIADYSELSRLPNAVEESSDAAVKLLSQLMDDGATLVVFTLKEELM